MTRKKLLLVEDDRALAELLICHFEREDFDVRRTGDGEEALMLADEEQAGPHHPRLDDRGDQRHRSVPPPAPPPGDRQRADHHADRARRGERPDPRPRNRRRRLCHQAVQSQASWSRASARYCAGCGPRSPPNSSAMTTSRWTSPRTASGATVGRSRLGPTEFRLLRHFLENPGRVFSRERLLDAVWPHDPEIDLRTVDVHVRRLAQGAQRRRAARHHPDGPLGRLFARRRSLRERSSKASSRT